MGRKIRAAFQGERGAFSEAAAGKLLGESVSVVPCQRFDQVFAAVASGAADVAVVPIENSLHGSIHENYDHLQRSDLTITGETSLRIVHNLIAAPGAQWKDVRRVYSHPVALNQCLKFFAAHPKLEKVPFYDTAGSVKMLMEERPEGAAAIASAIAADTYGANILKKSIEDDRQNFTRFFLLRPERPRKRTADAKTTLVFTTPNKPGALFRAMSVFALRDISLTKIESRPLKGKPWEYLFYVDFLGDVEDPKCRRALEHLSELAETLRVLGSYPRGE